MKKIILAVLTVAALFAFCAPAAAAEPEDLMRYGLRPWFHKPMLKEPKVRRAAARHHREVSRRAAPRHVGGMVTVPTAAGIDITVAPAHAAKFQGFIADLVARGDKPKFIKCYASGGHVRGSLHYRGEACDIDQRGWNKTSGPMYRVAGLASRHGLRDGCTFRDCGHIDTGARLGSRAGPSRLAGHWPIPYSGLQDIQQ